MAAEVQSGALLGFKVGTQAALDTMLSNGTGAQHGCFYLTKDSHRLYVGNEDGSLSSVNEGIEFISRWDDLTAMASAAASSVTGVKHLTGRFFYVDDKNVLCVYNGRNWVQLNENTNNRIDSNTYAVSASNNVGTVTNTVADDGGREAADSFTITANNGLTLTGSGKAITISGDTYTLSTGVGSTTGTVEIKLDSTNTTNDSKVTLTQGDNVQLTRNSDTGVVTIAATDNYVSEVDVTAESAGFKFKVTNSGGAFEEDTIDPKVAIYTSADPSATTTNSVSFVSGTATLDVYSRSAIDSKLQAVNAMVYRGLASNDGGGSGDSFKIDYNNGSARIRDLDNNAVDVSIGDTFLMTKNGTFNGTSYEEGSLFIVRALEGESENANGVIAAGDYTFDIVKERSNSDTTYYLDAITEGVQLKNSVGTDVGSFVVTAGANNDWINIAETTTDATLDGKNKTLTITHKNVTRTNTPGTAVTQTPVGTVTIPVVTGVTSDAKGHITGVETTSYTLTDTNADLQSVTVNTGAYSGGSGATAYTAGTITTTTVLENSAGGTTSKSAAVVLNSSSLTISNDDSKETAASGGAAAEGLKIEMVWGSF